MLPIAATDFGALAILAEWWVRHVDRVPTLELTNEQRRGSPAAAAAFAVKTFRNLPLEACRACGRWRGSWCEGCYAVAVDNPEWTFSALCTECDREHITCPRCRHHGITWQAGHDAYRDRKHGPGIPENPCPEEPVSPAGSQSQPGPRRG